MLREQPIFTCKAYVFHIDPATRRSWLPASTQPVPVSFFFDSSRSLYRIISVEGTKAVINSTMAPAMNFTKTSLKFGQWADVRANIVYGLGFLSEAELNKFTEQFQAVKDSMRTTNKDSGEGSQGKVEGTSGLFSGSGIPSNVPPLSPDHQMRGDAQTTHGLENDKGKEMAGLINQRSFHLSDSVLPNMIPAPHTGGAQQASDGKLSESMETQLKQENERLRLALAQSSTNAKKWEVELTTLKTNVSKLTSALQESNTNVEEWKKQLQAYKEDNQRLKQRALEAEAAGGNTDAARELRNEIAVMRDKVSLCQQQMKLRDEEIRSLKEKGAGSREIELRETLLRVQGKLEIAVGAQSSHKRVLDALHTQVAENVQDLTDILSKVNTALRACNTCK